MRKIGYKNLRKYYGRKWNMKNEGKNTKRYLGEWGLGQVSTNTKEKK